MHELYLGSRREIEVYKVLRKINEENNISLRKKDNGFYIGDDFVRVLDNGDIKLNGEKVTLKDISLI